MSIESAKLFLTPFIYLAAVALAIFLVWLFRKPVRKLLQYLGISNLKFAGVEISLSSSEIDTAQKKAFKDDRVSHYDEEEGKKLETIASLANPYIVSRRILWVDDSPRLNSNERRAFRLLGIQVVNCLNTQEAIVGLCRDDFDLVISDIGRDYVSPDDPCFALEEIRKSRIEGDDGWKTLFEINKRHRIPVIFYHGSLKENEERDERARREGAVGATQSPVVLYKWVLLTLLMKAVTEDKNLRHLIPFIHQEMQRRL